MSRSKNSMRAPLAKVRGLGSARDGTGHFITQRVSAVGLFILLPWLVCSLIMSKVQFGWEHAAVWLNAPWNAVPCALFVIAAFMHMRVGMQVVIEDYIQSSGTRLLLLILNTFVALAGAVSALFAIFRVFSWV